MEKISKRFGKCLTLILGSLLLLLVHGFIAFGTQLIKTNNIILYFLAVGIGLGHSTIIIQSQVSQKLYRLFKSLGTRKRTSHNGWSKLGLFLWHYNVQLPNCSSCVPYVNASIRWNFTNRPETCRSLWIYSRLWFRIYNFSISFIYSCSLATCFKNII